jgi:hypothetical protein
MYCKTEGVLTMYEDGFIECNNCKKLCKFTCGDKCGLFEYNNMPVQSLRCIKTSYIRDLFEEFIKSYNREDINIDLIRKVYNSDLPIQDITPDYKFNSYKISRHIHNMLSDFKAYYYQHYVNDDKDLRYYGICHSTYLCLHYAGLDTKDDVIDYINKNKSLLGIKRLGVKSREEVYNKLNLSELFTNSILK